MKSGIAEPCLPHRYNRAVNCVFERKYLSMVYAFPIPGRQAHSEYRQTNDPSAHVLSYIRNGRFAYHVVKSLW